MSYHLFSMIDRKAVKPHRCIWCGEAIGKSETYSDERSVYDGEVQRLRWHPECRADAEEGWARGDDAEFLPHSQERPAPLPVRAVSTEATGSPP
jgi:hypothetical protein